MLSVPSRAPRRRTHNIFNAPLYTVSQFKLRGVLATDLSSQNYNFQIQRRDKHQLLYLRSNVLNLNRYPVTLYILGALTKALFFARARAWYTRVRSW